MPSPSPTTSTLLGACTSCKNNWLPRAPTPLLSLPTATPTRQLLGYIKKDRQADALVEKLAGRFAVSDSVPYWHNIAFCLTQLPLSDRGLRKLSDGFAGYKHALVSDGEVQAAFAAVLAKAKKSSGKTDLKVGAGLGVWPGCGEGKALLQRRRAGGQGFPAPDAQPPPTVMPGLPVWCRLPLDAPSHQGNPC